VDKAGMLFYSASATYIQRLKKFASWAAAKRKSSVVMRAPFGFARLSPLITKKFEL
jgi:hypothetical protein